MVEGTFSDKFDEDAPSKEEEFKRYEDLLNSEELDLVKLGERWQVARSTFLAAKAKSLGVGHELF